MDLTNYSLGMGHVLENGSRHHAIETGGPKWEVRRVRANPRRLQGQVASHGAVQATLAASQIQQTMPAGGELREHTS
jgi:hypothetical protein